HYANQHRQEEPKISPGDLVYLSTKTLRMPKGRASKLLPKFIGPYKVLLCLLEKSNHDLELGCSTGIGEPVVFCLQVAQVQVWVSISVPVATPHLYSWCCRLSQVGVVIYFISGFVVPKFF
ncbi:hypothetical protein L208DRAFT_1558527, partial [Tricholoma matsutake]